MKRLIVVGFSTLALVALTTPAVALSDAHHDSLYDGMGNKLTEEFEDEFYDGLGNKLNGRFEDEFYDGMGNKMTGSAPESFYENHNGLGNQ